MQVFKNILLSNVYVLQTPILAKKGPPSTDLVNNLSYPRSLSALSVTP